MKGRDTLKVVEGRHIGERGYFSTHLILSFGFLEQRLRIGNVIDIATLPSRNGCKYKETLVIIFYFYFIQSVFCLLRSAAPIQKGNGVIYQKSRLFVHRQPACHKLVIDLPRYKPRFKSGAIPNAATPYI